MPSPEPLLSLLLELDEGDGVALARLAKQIGRAHV